MKDVDYHLHTKSFTELTASLSVEHLAQSKFGFHISGDSGDWIDWLHKFVPQGAQFPVQIMSGPALTLRYWSAIPEKLVEMVKDGRVHLVVHLPFVLTIYKDPKTLGYQWTALQELSDYYKSIGIWDKVVVLFHCGHPSLDKDGNLAVQAKFWEDVAKQNIKQFACRFSTVLIENLAGYRGELVDFSTPNGIVDHLFDENTPSNVALALDTEHLFGSGVTLEALSPKAVELIKFVHFNAAPPNVLFGQNVDLHSYTTIQSSLDRMIGPWVQKGSTFENYKAIGLSKIPAVFERHAMEDQVEDLKLTLRVFS